MDPLYIIVGLTAAIGAAMWYNRPLPPKKRTKKFGVPSKGATKVAGEGVPYRNSMSPDVVKTRLEDIRTVYDIFEHASTSYPDRNCMGIRKEVKTFSEVKVIDGVKKTFTFPQLGPYEWQTYGEIRVKVTNFTSGLAALGMKEGDFLAMYENTRPEWTMAARAAYAIRVILFTVYANLGQEALLYALDQGEIKYIFTNASLLSQLNTLHDKLPSIKVIIYNDTPNKANAAAKKSLEESGVKVISFNDVLELGSNNKTKPNPPEPEDLAAIMYTSGSTGNPKGVMITHANLVASVCGMDDVIDFRATDVMLHYLPLAHSMAFVVENVAMYHGLPFGYGSPRTLSDTGVRQCKGDLRELSPTLLLAVPTIYEKIRQGIMVKIKQSGFITQSLFSMAFAQKKNAYYAGVDTPFWNMLIFNKFKDRVGGRIRCMITGSAPLSPEVHDFIRVCFGCPLIQGYGLTETCSSGTAQMQDDIRVSCVGGPLTTTEIKLRDVPKMNYLSKDNQGEILIRSASVTKGYYKNPEKTKEAFLEGGWFATGDIGRINEEGTLSIVDRIKNLIKPPHGEYIALEKLESVYRNSGYVELVCCYADSMHYYPLAIVQPSKPMLTIWAKANGVDPEDWEGLCSSQKVRAFLLKELQQTGKKLKLRSIETIKGVYIVPFEWTPDNQMLTAAMKLNRNEVYRQCREEIDAMYAAIKK